MVLHCRRHPSPSPPLANPSGGQVLNVLFAALIGGFALGQAAPNLQYFQQGATSGARVYAVMEREPLINLDAPGEGEWGGLGEAWDDLHRSRHSSEARWVHARRMHVRCRGGVTEA